MKPSPKSTASTFGFMAIILTAITISCSLLSPRSTGPTPTLPVGSTQAPTPSLQASPTQAGPVQPDASPTPEAPPTAIRPIAFVNTDIFGNTRDINLINPDGSGLRPLALDNANPEQYISACWPGPGFSPDGRYLAAARTKFKEEVVERPEGNVTIKSPIEPRELVVLNVETGQVVAVAGQFGGSFDWSPDNTGVLHTRPIDWDMNSAKPKPDQGLWLLDLQSGEDRQFLPPLVDFTVADLDWSPDGSRIAFHGAQYEGMGPFATINADGTGFRIWGNVVGSFDWSLDSQRLAHDEVTYIAFPPAKLFIVNADGSNATTLVDDESLAAVRPLWSPDGSLLAFIDGGVDVDQSVWLVEPDGANLRRLNIPGLKQVTWISWSPDGTRLVVTGMNQIFAVPLDGTAPLLLSEGSCATW